MLFRSQQTKFRQDLYYRLNVITVPMPALRELRNDIADIANQFLLRLRGDKAIQFSPAALQALHHHDFPGNVRELENVIERALALCSNDIITPADLQLELAEETKKGEPGKVGGKYPLPDYLDGVERTAILEALHQTGFNRTAAAKILGVTVRALRHRMERLNITDKDAQP